MYDTRVRWPLCTGASYDNLVPSGVSCERLSLVHYEPVLLQDCVPVTYVVRLPSSCRLYI